MRKEIRREIILAAKKLFNERGYNDVSTQSIADAMGISKGNLHYHFKRKEDIIEAVVEEMHSHYVKPAIPETLEALNTYFIRAGEVAKENAFYFWHYTQLAQMSARIREIQDTVMGNNYELLFGAFKRLNEQEILEDEAYMGQYEQIVQAVMLTCTYWTPHSRLRERLGIKGHFLDCVWGIIYPLLTYRGKAQCKVLRDDGRA